jgi:nucleoside-diphosphate-sugar epimerase
MMQTTSSILGRVAVLGASGFVGSRLVEVFHLNSLAQVVPVVRRVGAMARPSRFDLDTRLADVRHLESLSAALSGCRSVVDCTVGMPADIEAGARVLMPAAKAAGVQRVVYLSTASVHGQNPAEGSDEKTPLSDQQEIAYNNAKVHAERRLFADAQRLGIELFVLRPSIVFGPRDRWISALVKDLEQGVAWLIEDGQGICNTIYVDNLVEAIRLCLKASSQAAGQVYLVGDKETISWHGLYESTARGLGVEFATVSQISTPTATERTLWDVLNAIRVHPATQRLIAAIPSKVKGAVKGAIAGFRPRPAFNPWKVASNQVMIQPSREMVLLQQCRYHFPQTRAADSLGYKPVVTFEEGLRRTLAWLKCTSY